MTAYEFIIDQSKKFTADSQLADLLRDTIELLARTPDLDSCNVLRGWAISQIVLLKYVLEGKSASHNNNQSDCSLQDYSI